MNKNIISNTLKCKGVKKSMTRAFYKTTFTLKKRKPEILVCSGAVGVVASVVLACKATTKASALVKEYKDNVEAINECKANADIIEGGKYSEEEAKKELMIVRIQTGAKFAKLYGPALIIGSLSLGAMIASNNILRKRNIALGAAYATVDKSYKEYRNRVIERFGKNVDRELKHNIKTETVEETVTDPKTGKEKKVTKTVEVFKGGEPSEFAKFYDIGCKGWSKDPETNQFFLRAQQTYANDLLLSRGYLFLNEVYDMLGLPITKAGQVVGWVYDDKNPDHMGDNYVDFGIYDLYSDNCRDFVNGRESTILLDFNVDGNIWDLMK